MCDKICHIWGVTSGNWECNAVMNGSKRHVCGNIKKNVNRRVTIIEGLQNIMQKVCQNCVTGLAPNYVTGQNIEAL